MSSARPTFSMTPRSPRLTLPPLSCNAHCHIFGPAATFPYAVPRDAAPADAPKDVFLALQRHLGLDRAVIVQTLNHGYDHAAAIETIQADPDNHRGIALVPLDVADAELARLNAHGFRGARFHLTHTMPGTETIDDIVRFGDRLARFGWHLQLHINGEQIPDCAAAIHRSAVPVVIDHMADPDASPGLYQPGFIALRRLLEDKNVWVKISGCDRATRAGPPYTDTIPFVQSLMAQAGDRAVWGTDWPHTKLDGPIPDDGLLVDLLGDMIPDPAERHRVLVDNPGQLYGFP
ncbi:amidohydrolase family protein [Methylobacterium platani]|uniref:Amidohydrolase-related domain-containing protein n=1 Tax=Methylobacterium platani JCM 14648 TaxID=1295136 RepID=A0ABR5GXQ3_9HYPH|nr:amidohydrolase family protein [Methylobacterium platani]KMO14869.1 hypothetical protein SQ03_18470 [Methylobacterium platani JCM 14648]